MINSLSDNVMTSEKYQPSLRVRIEALDELRGIAILFVLVAHWGLVIPSLQNLKLGPIGVDVFFVVSGFLIATILQRTCREKQYFRTFYVRRAFRILPLAAVVVAMGFCLQWFTRGNAGSISYYLGFVQNYIPAFRVENLGQQGSSVPLPGTSPMWSLAVEEHVYLILPLVFRFIPKTNLLHVLVLLAISGILFHLSATIESSWDWYTNHRETQNRIHYIIFGALISEKSWDKYLGILLTLWLTSSLFLWGIEGGAQPAIAILICSLVCLARNGRLALKNVWLAAIGKLCFGIYLLHYPVAVIFKGLSKKGYLEAWGIGVLAFLVYISVSIVLAILSFRYFEMPIQRQRGKFE